jgi:2-oxo-4-hydroxy-4-carboxy--5-ureidoimidazoline (OHCU) decarboxylase
MSSPLPEISKVPSLTTVHRAAILDTLFEPSTQLHTLSVSFIAENRFDSYPALIAAVGKQLTELSAGELESDQKWLEAILGSHPRLGEKKVDSDLSRKEQEAMKAAEGDSKAESGDGPSLEERLKDLNEKYEERFPGLRYVYVLPFALCRLHVIKHTSFVDFNSCGYN